MDEVVIELIQQIYPHTSLAQMAKTPHFLSTVFHDSNRGAALLRAHAETEHQHHEGINQCQVKVLHYQFPRHPSISSTLSQGTLHVFTCIPTNSHCIITHTPSNA